MITWEYVYPAGMLRVTRISIDLEEVLNKVTMHICYILFALQSILKSY